MKKTVITIVLIALTYGYLEVRESTFGQTQSSNNTDRALEDAFDERESNVQIEGAGIVFAILPDDLKGSRHQKFLIRLNSGQSLMVSHNIDLAPRINDLSVGDEIEFFGEYEWNDKGGVIHWTHHDPARRHVDGWIRHQGKTFQ